MQFRIGHEVRFEVVIEAANEKEAVRIAEEIPYKDWTHNYTISEDVLAIEESPVNPMAQ
jgi:hypothetical protein